MRTPPPDAPTFSKRVLRDRCFFRLRFAQVLLELFDLAAERQALELREAIDLAEAGEKHLHLKERFGARLAKALFLGALVVGPTGRRSLEFLVQAAELGRELGEALFLGGARRVGERRDLAAV